MKAIIAVLVSAALTGCAGQLGQTDMRSDFQPVSKVIEAIGKACPDCGDQVYMAALATIPDRITYADGKDKTDIQAQLEIGNGGFTYSAADEGATSPAEVRARITEALGESTVQSIEQAFPDGIAGLVDVLRQTGALP